MDRSSRIEEFHNRRYSMDCPCKYDTVSESVVLRLVNTAAESEIERRNILGTYSSRFTASKDLFDAYPTVQYWRFEVVYSITSQPKGVGTINFIVNTPPRNGTCRTDPLNGTTDTLFTIICSGWFDDDSIRDYSFYSTFS